MTESAPQSSPQIAAAAAWRSRLAVTTLASFLFLEGDPSRAEPPLLLRNLGAGRFAVEVVAQ